MGDTGRKGIQASNVSLGQSIKAWAKRFPLDPQGRFGKRDLGSQIIETTTPVATALELLEGLTSGGKLKETSTTTFKYYRFPGSNDVVVYREVSDSGSPAIDINAKSHFGRQYRIHFVLPGQNLGAKK